MPPPFPPTTRRTLLGIGAGAAGLAGCQAASSSAGATDPVAPELEALFESLPAGLVDQTHSGRPISPHMRALRRERASRLLAAERTDAILIEPGPTLDYLTGVSWRTSERLFALVLLADGSMFWICPAFEAERARETTSQDDGPGGPIVPWNEHEYATHPLVSALHERGVESIAIEPKCRFFVGERLALEFGRERVRSGESVSRALRSTKDEHELALMRRASELTKQAIAAVAATLRPGLREPDIGALVRHAQERLGLTDTWALALIGPSAAEPHGNGGDDALKRGDVVLIDTGGTFHGYRSDVTRSWVFGAPPSQEVTRVWNTVRDAQKRAFETLRPGAPAADADRAARRVIEAAGYGGGYEYFTHRLGHGIGLEVHEEPYLDSGNGAALVRGMTFSNEPGIYLRGRFGVRIEDIVCITSDGADVFGDWQPSPAAPA